MDHLKEKVPACNPSKEWWIVLFCLDSVATLLSATCQSLQGHTILLSQQAAQLSRLCASLSELCYVNGPLSGDDIAHLNLNQCATRGSYAVKVCDALVYVRYHGTFVIDCLAAFNGEEVTRIGKMIGTLFVGLYAGIKGIVATRTSQNSASENEVPPVSPHQLVQWRTSELCELLRGHRGRLENAGWSRENIDHIEADHRGLLNAFREESVFKTAVKECSDSSTTFEDGWSLTLGRFEQLRQFCGGLASIFPNTARVEADFSLIGWEKDHYRQSLTDLSLEGILHAKQFDTLRSLSERL